MRKLGTATFIMRFTMRVVAGILITAVLCAQSTEPAAVDYARDVAPIFAKTCLPCHNNTLQSSGFRLDDPASALKGGYGGAAIVPGNSSGSALVRRVRGDAGIPAMPPAGPRLSADQVEIIRRWIDEGAPFPSDSVATPENTDSAAPEPSHWSFRRIAKPPEPPVKNPNWVRNPVDAFVLAKLESQRIEPSREAEPRVLLRRLSLDLTGLPPTPDEVAAYLRDESANAYERQVERLLASPHFGEKWARNWLDQARYADSDGYEKDWLRPWAWRWRNWVIEAINQDMPFDRFTIEQIAGDLLPGASTEQRVATGFHRNTLTNREGGVDSTQFEFEAAVDRASTVGTVWLGLSVGCAQCHDHKFDPISQKDFYSFFAWFEPVEEIEIDAPLDGEIGPWMKTYAEYREQRSKLLDLYEVPKLQADWEADILHTIAHPGERTDWDLAWDCVLKLTEGGDGAKIVQTPPSQRSEREQDILTDHFIENAHFAYGPKLYRKWKLNQLKQRLEAVKQQYPQLTQATVIMEEQRERTFHLRVRGDYQTMGIEVHPATLSVLPTQTNGTRLDLARWLVAPENPLTARVTVNRFWQEIFGKGLVATTDDFGTQGESPSHPELLDWLASSFRDGGWSRKQLIRLLVTSSTYRQSSDARPDLAETDPDNRLLARQNRLRLPAELVRDSSLAVSGLLTRQVGGPSIRPPLPKGVMELSYASRYAGTAWKESTGLDRYRRGLYVQFLRTTPYPQLMNFDAPKAVLTACSRDRSNTPLQALNLLNDPVFVEAAQALAMQTLIQAPPDFDQQLSWAFQTALGRPPTLEESLTLRNYYEKQRILLADDKQAIKLLSPSAAPGATALETATWTGVASVLLNLDEFITRE